MDNWTAAEFTGSSHSVYGAVMTKLSEAQVAEIKARSISGYKHARAVDRLYGSSVAEAAMASDVTALLSDREALQERVRELEGAIQPVYRAVECNAAPINVLKALEEVASTGSWITIDPELLIDLFKALKETQHG